VFRRFIIAVLVVSSMALSGVASCSGDLFGPPCRGRECPAGYQLDSDCGCRRVVVKAPAPW
jgi:hypothetical protein